MSKGFDLQELAEIARDKSPEGRSKLFEMLTRLFWRSGAIMKSTEKVTLAEILRDLRPTSLAQKRLELAYEIANSILAESDLLKVFADDEIEIASPILFSDNKLQCDDLIFVIEHCERTHASVISKRKKLDESVVDALIRLEDKKILHELLANPNAAFSMPALSSAALLSTDDIQLQRLVAGRPELPESIAEDMINWADSEVCEMLNNRFLFDAMTVSAQKPIYGQKTNIFSESSPKLAEEKSHPIELMPHSLIEALRAGNLALFQSQIENLADIRVGLVRKLMNESGHESIAVIARALDWRRDRFAQIYLQLRKFDTKSDAIGVADLGHALDFFDRLETVQAKNIIARWRGESSQDSQAIPKRDGQITAK